MDGGGGFLAAITRWLTPSIFFCLLNLMVITIFIRSTFKPKKNNNQEQHTLPPLITYENNPVHFFRFPSLLNRVKSFNFSRNNVNESAERYHTEHEDEHAERYQHAEPEYETAERYPVAKPEDEHAERYQHAEMEDGHEERYQHAELEDEPAGKEKEPEEERHVARTMSDTMEMVVKRQGVRGGVKMIRRSQSLKIVRLVEEEEEIEAVERERPATVRESKGNEKLPFDEDEAKANDFINRFKQQLKLQRLESFLNYRGASK